MYQFYLFLQEHVFWVVSLNTSFILVFGKDYLINNDYSDVVSGRFPLQSFCSRGRSEHVSTFAIGV